LKESLYGRQFITENGEEEGSRRGGGSGYRLGNMIHHVMNVGKQREEKGKFGKEEGPADVTLSSITTSEKKKKKLRGKGGGEF